jgi:uncharacterized protein YegL
LPVIVLADVSGSMADGGKINALNTAIREMLTLFTAEDGLRAEIHVAVVTFGDGGARLHQPLAPARSITWANLTANGPTPMGEAFTLARQLIEDKEVVPSRAYRPTVILVTDGQPTDGTACTSALNELLQSERGGKAFRLAMGIGADADHAILNAFLADTTKRVFTAADARQITEFFRFASMSVTSRTRSQNPNLAVPSPVELEF